jgi:hypothetical protein
LLSSLFAIVLYNLSAKRFSRKHVMIFILIAFTGPDMTGNFGGFAYSLGHSVLGWPIFALILTPIIAFLTRFHFDVRHLQLLDDGPNSSSRLSWWRAYFVATASGIFHFTVDLILESKGIWNFPDEWREDAYSLLAYFNYSTPFHDYFSWVTIVITVLLFFGCFMLLQQADISGKKRRINVFLSLLSIIALTTYLITGVSGEQDLGAIVFVGGFVIVPMVLCVAAAFPEKYQVINKVYNESKAEIKLKMVSLVFLLFSTALIGTVILFSAYYPVGFVGLLEPSGTVDTILENFVPLLIGVIVLAVIFGITGLLLFKKSLIGHRLAHFFLLLTSIMIIPLVLWGLIREEEVLTFMTTARRPAQ